ncbi:hypothetical protein FISHEDRAFT_69169 [Fistulina hepatica ATCC 64428]|uniref:Uncharacterized protein n=1 Tax=Fistulina hepatica ATCC 64428 TaxID=1128425 RepID=A0A0D7AP28_9AGAR|nr:hypothetical protein FISHEDRAFT_69169 [Fistulina hepatica ATCC 64428]
MSMAERQDGCTWATKEQTLWLDEKAKTFIIVKGAECQVFVSRSQTEFFERWPEHLALFGRPEPKLGNGQALLSEAQRKELDLAHEKCKKQTLEAFRWRSRNEGTNARRANHSSMVSCLMCNIASSEAQNRQPQDLEIYCHLYYGVLMKDEVDARYKAMKAASLAHKEANSLGDTLTIGEGQSLSMSAHWEVVLKGWQRDKNDPIVLRAIQDVRELQEREGTNDDVLTTEEIQRRIQEIGPLIHAVHDFIYNHMGWCAYTKFGGVNEAGILKVYSVDVGTLPNGKTIQTEDERLWDQHNANYLAWLEKKYPPAWIEQRGKDIEKNIPLRLRKAERAEKGNGRSSLSELDSRQARTIPSSTPMTAPQFQTPVPESDSFLPDIPVDMGLLEGNSVQEMMALYDNPNLWDAVTVSDDLMSNFAPGGSMGVLSNPFDSVTVSDHSDFISGESAGVPSDPFYMMMGCATATHSDSFSSSSMIASILWGIPRYTYGLKIQLK